MSNQLQNWHVEIGSPFGEYLSDSELSDAVGCLLERCRIRFLFDSDGNEEEVIIGDVGLTLN